MQTRFARIPTSPIARFGGDKLMPGKELWEIQERQTLSHNVTKIRIMEQIGGRGGI
jgi:hypothetical protein